MGISFLGTQFNPVQVISRWAMESRVSVGGCKACDGRKSGLVSLLGVGAGESSAGEEPLG